MDFFASNPMFYDQTLKEFKDKTKRDHLLGVIGNDIGLTCKCKLTFFQNDDVLQIFIIYFHNYKKSMFLVYFQRPLS